MLKRFFNGMVRVMRRHGVTNNKKTKTNTFGEQPKRFVTFVTFDHSDEVTS